MMKNKKLVSAILAAASIAGGVVSVQATTIEGLEAKVNTYTSRVQQAETRIGTLETKVKALDTTGIADNKAKIEAEATARTDADKKHDEKISALEKKTDKHDWKIDTLEKKTGVNTPLTNGATNLSAGVNENTRKIDAEATARENAVTGLQSQVTTQGAQISQLQKDMAQEGMDRAAEMDKLTTKVNQKADKADVEANKNDIASNAAAIKDEAQKRENAVNKLQNQVTVATGRLDNVTNKVTQNADAIGTLQEQVKKSGAAYVAKQSEQIETNKNDIGTIFGQLDQGAYNQKDGYVVKKDDTIGGALNKLDKNTDKQHWQIEALQKKTGVNTPLTNGATNLSAGVNQNTKLVEEEAKARKDADTQLQANIEKETADRIAGDNVLNSRINQVESDATKGIAKASALAALHPLDYDPDNKFDIAAAGGFYKGENAFALGAFYRPNRNVMLSMGTTLTGGDNAYNVGLTFKIGKSGKHTEAGLTTADLYAMIGAMQDKMDQQQKKIEELEAKQAK